MAKLNVKAKSEAGFTPASSKMRDREDATVNEEGGLALKMDAKTEFFTRVLTALWKEPKFYDASGEKGDEAIVALVGVMAKQDPEFVLKLAAYARNEMYLRTIPQVLLAEATAYPETKKFVRKWTPSIIRRADELAAVIAYYQNRFGHIGNKSPKGMLAWSLKKGVSDAFPQFDAYQLAKYDRDGVVKLRDVLRICHPKPKNSAQSEMWKMLLKRELPVPKTWETELSTKGSSKETWEGIIPRMGYMSLLRNLRNLIQHGVDIAPVLKTLTDPKRVRASKQFPFRFYSAYRMLQENGNLDELVVNRCLEALETALLVSADNLPHLPGVTFISADNSGSMSKTISEKSKVELHQIANLLQSIAHKTCDQSITSVFGDTFAVAHVSKTDGVITNMEKFRDTQVGCSTNAWLSIKWLNDKKQKVDRIIIFSDEQCYSTHGSGGWMPGLRMGYGDRGQSLAEQFEAYKRNVNPKALLYSIDLAGYGTAQFPMSDKSVVTLAGWSEKLLDFISKFEAGRGDALARIDKMEPLPIREPRGEHKGDSEDTTDAT